MSNGGAIFVSIDKEERLILESVLNNVFGDENKVEELIWAMNTNNSQSPNYSTNHEYIEVYAKDKSIIEKDKNMFREPKPGYDEVMELVARLNPSYPPVEVIEQEIKKLYERHKIEYREEIEAQGLDWEEEKRNDPWKGLYNYNNAEYRDENGKLIDPKEAKNQKASIWIWASADSSMPASKQAESTRNPDHPNWRFYRPPHPITQKPCPHPKSGWKFAYRNDENSPDRRSFVALDNDSRIAWGEDETNLPRVKRMLNEVETNVGKSVFSDYSDGEKQTSAMFGQSGLFLAPKHANFVARFIEQATYQDSLIVDCFGGTGSTAHGVIKINRMDRGKRKYILVEMGEHFNTILKPRIQKVVYAQNWKDGKPIPPTPLKKGGNVEGFGGISHCFKYLRLESYEDTLNNLELNPVNSQFLQQNEQLQREYLLHYLLDIETKGSQSLLNIDNFANPSDYRLKIKIPGTDEYQEKAIDLIETFNYLIGLRVIAIDAPQQFTAEMERQPDPELPAEQLGKLVIKGKLKNDPNGQWWFRKIEGTVPKNPHTPNDGLTENVLIVWRNLTGDLEQDNLILGNYSGHGVD